MLPFGTEIKATKEVPDRLKKESVFPEKIYIQQSFTPMKNKLFKIFVSALSLVLLAGQAKAALLVTNGDFSDLTGLSSSGGNWYGGAVPYGWTSSVGGSLTYAVINSGGNYIANLGALSTATPFAALTQNIGILDNTASITLTYTLTSLSGTLNSGVAIYNASNGNVLASATFNTSGTHSVTALDVAAGTQIRIGFWQASPSNSPGLDNVMVTVVPEPGSLSLALGGIAVMAVLRRRHRQGV